MTSGSDSPGVDYEFDYQGICPCGQKFYVDCSVYSVIHELPMCEPFRQLEPDQFLHYVRVTRTGITDN